MMSLLGTGRLDLHCEMIVFFVHYACPKLFVPIRRTVQAVLLCVCMPPNQIRAGLDRALGQCKNVLSIFLVYILLMYLLHFCPGPYGAGFELFLFYFSWLRSCWLVVEASSSRTTWPIELLLVWLWLWHASAAAVRALFENKFPL